jgi:hypothetical protein
MRLIKDKLRDHDFSGGCVEHKVRRLYVKKVKSEDAPVAPGSFMGDARSSVPGKFVSKDVPKRVKKLSWFQKHVLYMKIHRENYQAYREHKVILDTQREILHKLSGQQAALSPPPPAIAYSKWHTDSYDWGVMERSLFVGHTPRDNDDVEDEEEDEDKEEEAQSEEDEEEEEEAEENLEEDEDDDDFV